jgi:predicted oxidoreductase (fatty acid repression mutant protein)
MKTMGKIQLTGEEYFKLYNKCAILESNYKNYYDKLHSYYKDKKLFEITEDMKLVITGDKKQQENTKLSMFNLAHNYTLQLLDTSIVKQLRNYYLTVDVEIDQINFEDMCLKIIEYKKDLKEYKDLGKTHYYIKAYNDLCDMVLER